jgi:hypothetical protein
MELRHPLSGADNFQVLLDRHMRKRSRVGNVVRLSLQLDPAADLNALASGIAANPNFRIAVSLGMKRATLMMPRWHCRSSVDVADHVAVHERCTSDYFNVVVLHRDLPFNGSPVHVDVLHFANGSKRLVISAHHALFDQRGMVNLANAIAPGAAPWPQDQLFPQRTRQHWWPEFRNTVYIMFYMLGSPFWFMARLLRGTRGAVSNPVFKVVQLNQAQRGIVDRNAWGHGARFGNSNYHLAITLQVLQQVFDHRREQPPYFWLSMPVSTRRKGTAGHLFSNSLSFVFARLKADEVRDPKRAVAAIHTQVKKQLSDDIPGRYTSLLNFFRRVPLWLYSTLVNLPMRGDYASLSFSDLGNEGEGIASFGGVPVLGMVDYASVPSPPGLTVTFKRNAEGLQVVVGAVCEALSPSEFDRFQRDLVQLLTRDEAPQDGTGTV